MTSITILRQVGVHGQLVMLRVCLFCLLLLGVTCHANLQPQHGAALASFVSSFRTSLKSPHARGAEPMASAATAAGGDNNSPLNIPGNYKVVTEGMPTPLPDVLRNRYYLLRHGQSTGNVEGVISSARSLATSAKHGLTLLGREQAQESAKNLLQHIAAHEEPKSKEDKRKVILYSSPFARARETAEWCLRGLFDKENGKTLQEVERLGLDISPDYIVEDGLMERFFGRLDNAPIETYAYVWPLDMFNVTQTAFDVESVAQVASRLREVILRLEETHEDCSLVLVSHADVLQITQLYAAGIANVGTFSQYRFGNGEVRAMQRNVDSLPEPVPLKPPRPGT